MKDHTNILPEKDIPMVVSTTKTHRPIKVLICVCAGDSNGLYRYAETYLSRLVALRLLAFSNFYLRPIKSQRNQRKASEPSEKLIYHSIIRRDPLSLGKFICFTTFFFQKPKKENLKEWCLQVGKANTDSPWNKTAGSLLLLATRSMIYQLCIVFLTSNTQRMPRLNTQTNDIGR